MSTEQIKATTFSCILGITNTFADNEDIFHPLTGEDFEQLFFYCTALYMKHDGVHGGILGDDMFLTSVLGLFYKMLAENGVYSKQYLMDRLADDMDHIFEYHAIHNYFIENYKSYEDIMDYVRDLFPFFPSLEDKGPFTAEGIAFAATIPKVLDSIRETYDILISSWDKNLENDFSIQNMSFSPEKPKKKKSLFSFFKK